MLSSSYRGRWRRTLQCGWALALAACLVGCNDPYSQRRIERRWAHFDETAEASIRREEDGTRRMEEARKTLEKWWRADCERFDRKAPTVGDYVW